MASTTLNITNYILLFIYNFYYMRIEVRKRNRYILNNLNSKTNLIFLLAFSLRKLASWL